MFLFSIVFQIVLFFLFCQLILKMLMQERDTLGMLVGVTFGCRLFWIIQLVFAMNENDRYLNFSELAFSS